MGQGFTECFVGRDYELSQLNQFLNDSVPRIALIYGRRRVGKTRLVNEAIQARKAYRFEGLEGQATSKQKVHFANSMADQFANSTLGFLKTASWQDIFKALAGQLSPGAIVCMDEFQWIAAGRSDLVSALKFAWDNYFAKVPGVKLVICGSISSFLVKKVLRSKALYGRVSLSINLKQLSLAKFVAAFSTVRNIHELLDYYLTVGGVPEYWSLYNPSVSTISNINNLAFHGSAYFASEYDRIFTSHFGKRKVYQEVVKALSHSLGLTRQELAAECRVKLSGNFSAVLEDLELSGFITSAGPFDKANDSKLKKYYLADFFLRFYLTFIQPNRARVIKAETPIHINSLSTEGARAVWRGMAFELLCHKEAERIARILGFSAVKYTFGPFLKRQGGAGGLQIDLLFWRVDKVIVLCEIKYQQAPIDLSIISEIEEKIARAKFPVRMAIEKVLISAGPVTEELRRYGYFSKVIGLEELVRD